MSSPRECPHTGVRGMGEAVEGMTMVTIAITRAGAGPCGPVASSLDMAGMKIPSAGHPVALAL